MSKVEIKEYSVFTYPNNTARINLYLKDGSHAYLTDLDQVRVRLLVGILRNEKPVYWNPQSVILWAGREPVGEEESKGPTPIDIKYASLGGEGGFLGKPIVAEQTCADGEGAFRHYKNGSIFWHPSTGAHEIHGAILSKYRSWAWERGALGYPITDELDTPDEGRYSRFQRGLIVWTPELGAHGICEDGINLDYMVDFEKLAQAPCYRSYRNENNIEGSDETYYGNLKGFYENIKKWYHIDLKYNVHTESGEKRYVGWQVANFWGGDYTLNGYQMSSGERLVITIAQVLLMQWHLRDLRNHDEARRAQITRYFPHIHIAGKSLTCFKQRKVAKWKKGHVKWKWKYNKWCSEFVSYVYARAGIPTSLGKKQCFWCQNHGRYRKTGKIISNIAYYIGYFKSRNSYRRIRFYYYPDNERLSLGNYLCRNYNGKKPCSGKVKGHSMLVVGFEEHPEVDEDPEKYLQSLIFYVNGNTGSGSPKGNGKLVKYQATILGNRDLTGVGVKTVSF